jgi:hypothetical protein
MEQTSHNTDTRKYDMIQPRRKNLWYCLLFLIFGGILIRLAYLTADKTLATVLLAIGVLFLCVVMVIFWLNFRE